MNSNDNQTNQMNSNEIKLSPTPFPQSSYTTLVGFIGIILSEVGGVRPVGPPIGKSFRFVSCVRARGAGEVAAECFWDPTGQSFDQQSRGFKKMSRKTINSCGVLKGAIDLGATVQEF